MCLFVTTETTGRRSGPPLQFCSSQLAGEFHSVIFRRVGECTRQQEAAVSERRRAVRGDVLAAIAEASVTELSERPEGGHLFSPGSHCAASFKGADVLPWS